ncbi:FAD-binding protein [Candidatus Berkiella cookevillensis]|uniref:FAD binding domain protein n=1 Tax=Candidatus Berkiella cookevillensis TaxID=437022 RepID=A0A0Q9YSM1_9GAMM|nr:FAD-binding protein [Candidatus Berkiella cookevillensis]MCS5708565.1 FAD-binding protein [Candidatus Berkiella cookevillensis]
MSVHAKEGCFKKILVRSTFVLILFGLFYSFFKPSYHPVAIQYKAQLQAFPKIVVSTFQNSQHPYNTLEYIEDLIASDVDAFKVSVQATKDAQYFLYKPSRLDNYTDAQGTIASKYTKDLSCVYYQEPQRAIPYKLASLDETLARINGRKKIFIDVVNDEYAAGDSARGLASIIQKHQAFDYVVVESTNPFFLYALREQNPKIVIQYNFIDSSHKKYLGLAYSFTHIPWLYQWPWLQTQMIRLIQPDILGAHYTVERALLDVFLEKKFPVIVWDVNTDEMIKSFLSLGVMGVITNKSEENQQNTVRVQYPSATHDFKDALADARKINNKINILANAAQPLDTHAINLSLSRFQHMHYEADTNIIHAESGATFAQIQDYLTQFGRALGMYPYDSGMTVYQGVIENLNGIGFDRTLLSTHVRGMDVLLSNGAIIHCSREENKDLFESLLGGMGTIGVILKVSFATVDNLYLFAQASYEEHNPPAVFWYRGDENTSIQFEQMQKISYGIFEPRAVQFQIIKINPIARYVFESSRRYQNTFTDGLNASLHDISSIFEPNPVSFNEVALLNRYPMATINSGIEIRRSHFVIPIALRNVFFEKLQAITKDYPSIQIIHSLASYVQKDDISLVTFAKNPGLGVTLFMKLKDNKDDLALYQKMMLEINDFVLQEKGGIHLQNLLAEPEKLMAAYPEIKTLKKVKLKYEPESFISNQYEVLLQSIK